MKQRDSRWKEVWGWELSKIQKGDIKERNPIYILLVVINESSGSLEFLDGQSDVVKQVKETITLKKNHRNVPLKELESQDW